MWAMLSLTSVASSASAWAAIAYVQVLDSDAFAFQSGLDPAEHPAHLIGPGCSRQFVEEHPEASGQAFPLLRLPQPRRTVLDFGDDRLGQEHVRTTVRHDALTHRGIAAHRKGQTCWYPGRTSQRRPLARPAGRDRNPEVLHFSSTLDIGLRRPERFEKLGAPPGLGCQRPFQGTDDVAVPAHVERPSLPVDRREQARGQMHRSAHGEWNTIRFGSWSATTSLPRRRERLASCPAAGDPVKPARVAAASRRQPTRGSGGFQNDE